MLKTSFLTRPSLGVPHRGPREATLYKKMLIALAFCASACTTTQTLNPDATLAASNAKPQVFDRLLTVTGTPSCRAKAGRKGGTTAPPSTPSDFADMGACQPNLDDALLKAMQTGTINDAGDCAFANGSVCHFHDGGNEFGRSGTGNGEVHCIFPTTAPARPTVVGFIFQCSKGTALSKPTADPATPVMTCGLGLSAKLKASEDAYRCCQNGYLTKAWSKQSAAERELRPTFAINSHPLVIDCGVTGILAGLRGHPTNTGAAIE